MAAAANAVQNEAETGKRPDAPAVSAPAGRVTELKVSAHLMTLEPGVYCVFPAPGSRQPDVATGLPGVRITRCPGVIGRPESVSISTFRDDGWLDNTAALVRVSDNQAQVLVTIYQDAGLAAESAPRLQVMRLTADPGAAAAPAAPNDAATMEPEIAAHIQTQGDTPGGFGDWIGKRGSGAWIEGFALSDKGIIAPGDIEYQGVLGKGWQSPWVVNGKFCGSRGMALPLLGINLRLRGEAAKQYKLRYSATFIDGSTAGPADEGTPCEAPSLAPLETFQIELLKRGADTGTRASTGKMAAAKPAPARAAPAKSSSRAGRR